MSTFKYTKEYIAKNHIAIKCDTAELAWSIYSIYNGKNNWDVNHTCFGFDGDDLAFYGEGVVVAYGETVIRASEVIAAYEASKLNRKIKGYNYPFDTYHGIEVRDKLIRVKGNKCILTLVDEYYIALEIVESFEPVYEEEKPTFGSFDDLISFLVKKGNNFESMKLGEEIIDKSKYDFTPEFKVKLKELGIKI